MWSSGAMLASLINQNPLFPKKLTLRGPTSAEITTQFDQVREWIAAIQALRGYRIEAKTFNHRVFGMNSMPGEIWVDDLDTAVKILGKQDQVRQFIEVGTLLQTRAPHLLTWLAANPFKGLEHAQVMPKILDVIDWIQCHPIPGCYIRQMTVPGVDTKFIEARRGVLSELLDRTLAPEVINATCTGASQFAGRYSFLDKPQRVRFRMLDTHHGLLPNSPMADITIDAMSFAALWPSVSRVFITENEVNFLAFPDLPDAMIVWGAGYGFDAIRHAKWLREKDVFYWGDIDSHAFAILNQLREVLPESRSFLMGEDVLLAHRDLWVAESTPTNARLMRLTQSESDLYAALCNNVHGKNIRLEQERIGYPWVLSWLHADLM
jgi:hypothetical protein